MSNLCSVKVFDFVGIFSSIPHSNSSQRGHVCISVACAAVVTPGSGNVIQLVVRGPATRYQLYQTQCFSNFRVMLPLLHSCIAVLQFARPSILSGFHVAANQVVELAEEVDPMLSFFAYQPLRATAKPGDSEYHVVRSVAGNFGNTRPEISTFSTGQYKSGHLVRTICRSLSDSNTAQLSAFTLVLFHHNEYVHAFFSLPVWQFRCS